MVLENLQTGVNMTQEIKTMDILKEPMAMGEVFAESGMFPDIKTQAQAVVKIMAGKELGLSPFESMASIYMVNGKLALTSKAMSSLIKKSKKYDYSVDELTETECKISFYKVGGTEDHIIGQSIFTFKDAAKAGLVNKDVWKNYPKNMLFARALSNGARFYCPDAICGYYATEELEDIGQEPVSPQKHIIEMTAEGVSNGGT